jgi:hypothetical protein
MLERAGHFLRDRVFVPRPRRSRELRVRWSGSAAAVLRESHSQGSGPHSPGSALTQPLRRRGATSAEAMAWRIAALGSHPGHPRGLLLAWPCWEWISHRIWPLSPIPNSRFGLLQFRLERFHGDPIVLPDGTRIEPGATVGEFHCDSHVMLEMVRRNENPYAAARADMACLATWLDTVDPQREIRAFHGITMLGSAAARLGFCVVDRAPSIKAWLDRLFMTGLLLLYTTDGLERLDRGRTLGRYPREVWMSRGELVRRYCNAASAGGIANRQQALH